MVKTRKWVPAVLASTMVLGTVIAGCSSSGGNTSSPSPSGGAASATPKQERIKMTMFYNEAGIKTPQSVDRSNNPLIQLVEDYANVDLEFDIPIYAEYTTKHNLVLSSGKLPDIFHSTIPDETFKAARDGAFIDLKKYYDASPMLQKVVTPAMMELGKDPISGKYFRIPMAYDKGPQGTGVLARFDLIQKYNAGKWPGTVEEWVELLRKIKKAEPDSTPMAVRPVGDNIWSYGGGPIFGMYGALPYGYRIVGGKVIPNVALPEFKEALKVMQTLYSEGILDKEFATTDATKYFAKLAEKNVLFQWNGMDQILPYQVSMTLPTATGNQKEQVWGVAPPLTTYPSTLKDRKYAIAGVGLPISGHGLFIPASNKNPDRAFKVIEGFAQEQLKDKIFWGNEGDTYTMKDGKRVANPDKMSAEDHTWKRQFAFLFGYTDGQDAQNANFEAKLGTPNYTMISNGMKAMQKEAEAIGLETPPGYSEPDEVLKKNAEIMQAINKFTTEFIMGRMSATDLDAAIADWEKKYRALKYDPLQKFLDANKDNLVKQGFKKAGW
ncbi:hypothetical protein [Paenibacillus koleovorans]|uniref:hypothetical protein n=1 Tax=Paenibacillus koleovorans TaxID=121608 RepID=UPI000FDCBEC0|nr:hypothetical protein [Paenibacillus koleovorans]